MSARGYSVAHAMVIVGLIVQILGLARIIVAIAGLPRWIQGIQSGRPDEIAATVVLLGCLALLYPVLRGRRWAIVTTVPLQLLLVAIGIPFFLNEFPRPGTVGFSQWFNIVTVGLVGVAAVVYGVLGALEASGRLAKVRFSAAGSGLTRRGAVVGAVAFAWLGTVILAFAVNQVPAPGASFTQAPDELLRISVPGLSFQPASLDLQAGNATAVFITNNDTLAHSFDIDALNVHVPVPANATVVAMIKPPAAGSFVYYCAVPGHKEAGMVGRISAR